MRDGLRSRQERFWLKFKLPESKSRIKYGRWPSVVMTMAKKGQLLFSPPSVLSPNVLFIARTNGFSLSSIPNYESKSRETPGSLPLRGALCLLWNTD